jgi:hypothetical protein
MLPLLVRGWLESTLGYGDPGNVLVLVGEIFWSTCIYTCTSAISHMKFWGQKVVVHTMMDVRRNMDISRWWAHITDHSLIGLSVHVGSIHLACSGVGGTGFDLHIGHEVFSLYHFLRHLT